MRLVMTTMMTNNTITSNLTKSILIGLFFVLLLGVSYVHESFSSLKSWKPYSDHYKKYNIIVKGYESDRASLLNKLENETINVENYIASLKLLKKDFKKDIKEYLNVKKELRSEYSFIGYSSFRYFMYDFGRSYVNLGAALLLLLVVLVPSLIKKFKIVFLIGSFGLIYVSFFWLFYVIFVKSNYAITSYRYSLHFISVLSTIIIIGVFYAFKYIEKIKKQTNEDLRGIIQYSEEYLGIKTI